MSVRDNLSNFVDGYKDVHKDNYYFSDSSYDRIGKDEELTKFFLKQVDADGSKYGGDVEKAKNDFLNQYTFKSNSIVGSIKGAVESLNYSEEEKQQKNFLKRMYDSAPNRLLGSEGFSAAAQALGYGLAGGLWGEGGGDAVINLITSVASPFVMAGKLGVNAALGAMGKKEAISYATKAITEGMTKSEAQKVLSSLGTQDVKDKLIRQVASKYALSNAKAEFAVNSILGGIGGIAEQVETENIGLSDGSWQDRLMNIGSGALVSGAIGGALGYGVGRFGEGRKLGKELVQSTRDGQEIMAKAGEGPHTYQEAVQDRIKELEAKQAELDAQEKAQLDVLNKENSLLDKYRIPYTDDEMQDINDNISSIVIDLQQEARANADPNLPQYGSDKFNAVANLLDNLPDFALAQREVIAAEKAMATGTPESRIAYTKALERWSALTNMAEYLRKFKFDDSVSVYNLIDDPAFMDYAMRLDENVKKAVYHEQNTPALPNNTNKGNGENGGNNGNPPVTTPPATPNTPNTPNGGAGGQGATPTNVIVFNQTDSRKKLDNLLQQFTTGKKTAMQVVQEILTDNNPENSSLGSLTPEDLNQLQVTQKDVLSQLPPEEAERFKLLTEAKTNPDGSETPGIRDLGSFVNSLPSEPSQLEQHLTNIAQQHGISVDELKGYIASYKQLMEETRKVLEEGKQQIAQEQAVFNQPPATPQASATPSAPQSAPRTREQIVAEAKKRQAEAEASRELTSEEKKAHINELATRVYTVREAFDSQANEALEAITDIDFSTCTTPAEAFQKVPEEYRHLFKDMKNLDDWKNPSVHVKAKAQEYADYSILNTVRQVCGTKDRSIFEKFLPLVGDDKDTVRLMKRMDDLEVEAHWSTLSDAENDAFDEALSSAIDKKLLKVEDGHVAKTLDPKLIAEGFLDESLPEDIKKKAITKARAVARQCDNNARFKTLKPEQKNGIKKALIEKRVKSYLERRKEFDELKAEFTKTKNDKANKALEAMLKREDGGEEFINGEDYHGYYSDTYAQDRLDERLGRYRETVNLTPRQKEEPAKPVYDENGNLLHVTRAKAVLDEKGNLLYTSRTRVVPFNTMASEANIRRNYGTLIQSAVDKASNRKCTDKLLKEAEALNPEGLASLGGGRPTERDAIGLIMEGLVDRLLDRREKAILYRLKRNIKEGLEENNEKAFEEVARRFGNTTFTEKDKAILTAVARDEMEHQTQREALSKAMQTIVANEKLTGTDKILLNKLMKEFDHMLKLQFDIRMEDKVRRAKDAVNFSKKLNNAGSSGTKKQGKNELTLKITKDDVVYDETNKLVLVKGQKVGTFSKNEKGQYIVVLINKSGEPNSSSLTPSTKPEDLLNRRAFKKAVSEIVPDSVEKKELAEATGGEVTSPTQIKAEDINLKPEDLSLDEGKGELKYKGEVIGTFTKDEEGYHISLTTFKTPKKLQPSKELNDLIKRKKVKAAIATLENEKIAKEQKKNGTGDTGTTAPNAESIIKDVKSESAEEFQEAVGEQGANAQRDLADSLTLFTSDDLGRTVADYYGLINPESQAIVLKIRTEDGITVWRKVGIQGDGTQQTMKQILGKLASRVDEGDVAVLGVPIREKGNKTPWDVWCKQNAFGLQGKGKTNPAQVKQTATQKELAERIAQIQDLGNDDAHARLKALESSLEEAELQRVYFPAGSGEEIDGLTYINQFEKDCQSVSISANMPREKYLAIVESLSAKAKQIETKLPHGYRRKNGTRINASRNLIQRMGGLNQSEKIATLRALQRLANKPEGRGHPFFYSAGKDKGFSFSLQEGAGKANPYSDRINLPQGMEGVQWSPAVAHELFHWGYSNLLTPDEKVQFLRNVGGKYFNKDGSLNADLISKVETSKGAIRGEDGSVDVAELFAYEGMAYYGNRLTEDAVKANDSFWDSLASKFKDLMQWLSGMRDNISPENIPLFEKILPAEYNGNRYEKKLLFDKKAVKTVQADTLDKNDVGVRGLNILNKSDEMRAKAYNAMFNPNLALADRMATLQELNKYLKGILHGSQSEIGSEFVTDIRGKVIGYCEQVRLGKHKMIENALMSYNILPNHKNKAQGTAAELYTAFFRKLGCDEDTAKQLAQEKVLDDVLGEDGEGTAGAFKDFGKGINPDDAKASFNNNDVSGGGDALNAVYDYEPTPEQMLEVTRAAENAVVEEAKKILQAKGEVVGFNNYKELESLLQSDKNPFEPKEFRRLLDVSEDAYYKKQEEFVKLNQDEGGNVALRYGDEKAVAQGAPKTDSTSAQDALGRFYDILTDMQEATIDKMRANGYDVVANERYRPGLPPKGEKFTPPAKRRGPKSPFGASVKEGEEAKAILGNDESGFPRLASPKIKAVLEKFTSVNPTLQRSMRELLYRYSTVLGKDDLTLKDVSALFGVEISKGVNGDASFSLDVNYLARDEAKIYKELQECMVAYAKDEDTFQPIISANLKEAWGESIAPETFDDINLYLFNDERWGTEAGEDAFKRNLKNLPQDISDELCQRYKAKDLDELISRVEYKKEDGPALKLEDGKKVSLEESIQRIFDNESPDATPDLGNEKVIKAYTPIVGPVAVGNEVGKDLVEETSVKLAMLAKGSTPIQAEITSKFLPKKFREFYDSHIQKLFTRLNSGLDVLIASNVKRCKNLGANFLSDVGEFFFEEHTAMVGEFMFPVERVLERLRGTTVEGRSKLRNQMANDLEDIKRNLITNNFLGRTSPMEKEVVNFMRTATVDNFQSKWNRASPEVRDAVKALSKQFDVIRNKMREAGLPVNDYRGVNGLLYYIPQRFNRDWVGANFDKFMDGMTKFFVREGKTEAEAKEAASTMWSHITTDHEFNGFSGSDPSFARKSGEGLYQRVLNFKSEDWKEFGLTDMFDNNLESLYRDYCDHAATMILRAKRYGVEGHGG